MSPASAAVPLTPLEPWLRHKIGAPAAGELRPALEVWQLDKLNATLTLARTRSPFYSRLLADAPVRIQQLAEWSQIPFTTPADLRSHPLQLLCVSQDEIHRVVTLQSSGTSGEPKRVYFTAADQELTIDFFAVGMSTFTQPGQTILILLPCQPAGSVGDLLRIALERSGCHVIAHGPQPDPLLALQAARAQPVDCIVASPTQALALAQRWPPELAGPSSVLLSTDSLPQAIRRILEETWGCAVYNHYGMTEMGLGGGVECAAHRGYHLRENDLLVEIIDPVQGTPVADGEFGEVVFTTLTRGGMPLIRYRTGDRSRFLTAPCPCGSSLKLLEFIQTRLDGVRTLNGQPICMADFNEVLFPIPGLVDFSVSLSGTHAHPLLDVEITQLMDNINIQTVQTVLASIPALAGIPITIQILSRPDAVGGLKKRVLVDKRGQNARNP